MNQVPFTGKLLSTVRSRIPAPPPYPESPRSVQIASRSSCVLPPPSTAPPATSSAGLPSTSPVPPSRWNHRRCLRPIVPSTSGRAAFPAHPLDLPRVQPPPREINRHALASSAALARSVSSYSLP